MKPCTFQPFKVTLGIWQAQPFVRLLAEAGSGLSGMNPAVSIEAHDLAIVVEGNDLGRHTATFCAWLALRK